MCWGSTHPLAATDPPAKRAARGNETATPCGRLSRRDPYADAGGSPPLLVTKKTPDKPKSGHMRCTKMRRLHQTRLSVCFYIVHLNIGTEGGWVSLLAQPIHTQGATEILSLLQQGPVHSQVRTYPGVALTWSQLSPALPAMPTRVRLLGIINTCSSSSSSNKARFFWQQTC